MTTLSAETPWTSPGTGPRAALPIPANAEFIRARQYCDYLGGITFTTLNRMIESDPEFPRPINFANRIRFFKVSDIKAYERLCEIRTAAKAAEKAAR